MEQLLLHLVGDYITQSDWMAKEKTSNSLAAVVHAGLYSLPFLLICDWRAMLVILSTHFLIDRYRLARYVVWTKNWLGPFRYESPTEIVTRMKIEGTISNNPVFRSGELDRVCAEFKHPRRIGPTLSWKECSATGYAPDRPAWLVVWLVIIADNTMHLVINYLAIKYL